MTLRVVAVGFCLFAVSAGLGLASRKGAGRDGTDWGKLSRSEQALYVGGYADGFQQGVVEAGGLVTEHQTISAEEARRLVTASGARTVAALPILFGETGISTYQIADAVSNFYRDFRNVRVCWNIALTLSVDGLAGSAPTESQLNAARQLGAEQGCK